MLSAAGRLGDPDTLLRAGASFGPRTANGEWWRLVTAIFVHRGLLTLLVDLTIIVAIGVRLERLVGPIAFALLFLSGGALANGVHLAAHPMAIRTGAWGATSTLVGALLAWVVNSLRTSSEFSIPRSTFRQIGALAALYLLASLAGDSEALTANLAAMVFGMTSGAVMMAGIADTKPAPWQLGAVGGAALAMGLVMVIPSHGVTDVRPEIARVLALEGRTAAPYDKAVSQFKRGTTTAEALAQMIDRQILPQVRQAGARLAALRGVPPEHQTLIADAEEYVRLRDESWALRSHALHTANMRGLRLADDRERASLDALAKLQAADRSDTADTAISR
jgi:rhomboid protease GluP